MSEVKNGYYRFPTLHENRIVFVADDDFWEVAAVGGIARRLTANMAEVATPRFSPDGSWLAFAGAEEGPEEVYVMPSRGGMIRRVTYLASTVSVAGWRGNRIVFASNTGLPPRHPAWLHEIEMDGASLTTLGYGPANGICFRDPVVVLGRRTGDYTRWKRYRGGCKGELLIDVDGNGQFRSLIELDGNQTDCMLIADRVYFLSDHEGMGNLYSCSMTGTDLRCHTQHADFFARNPSTDGKRIVYQYGGRLLLYDPQQNTAREVAVDFYSPCRQKARRYVKAREYLEDCDLSYDGTRIAIVSRGRPFTMNCRAESVMQHGSENGRHRLFRFLKDGGHAVAVSDEEGEDAIFVYNLERREPPCKIPVPNLGRPVNMKVSPMHDAMVVANHRNELIWVDLATRQSKVMDCDKFRPVTGFCWSPDGNWIAYAHFCNPGQSVIKIYDPAAGVACEVTQPVLQDTAPCFSADGQYLFFLSSRFLSPVYDAVQFDANFPAPMRPCLVTLRRNISSPFVEDTPAAEVRKNRGNIQIDFEGIAGRMVAFPVADGLYRSLDTVPGFVFYIRIPIEGTPLRMEPRLQAEVADLKVFDLVKREERTFKSGVSSFVVSKEGTTILLRSKQGIGLMPVSFMEEESASNEQHARRESGRLDLERIQVPVHPAEEWRQMFHEAWRLQRDYFWNDGLSAGNWSQMAKRYGPLLDRISTRSELRDLIKELQGELSTSHAREYGGDYGERPRYQQGFLGADYQFDAGCRVWEITHILKGDPWDPANASPLLTPGLNIAEGSQLLAVGNVLLDKETTPGKALDNSAGVDTDISVTDPDGTNRRLLTIKPLKAEALLRYREWVETNRRHVHLRTGSAAGYVHIPDMGPFGLSEFHRYYMSEYDRDAIIIDIRYNNGGHFSPLILEKLARRRIGHALSRWTGTEPYPPESPRGPLVCIANEYTGSDGDVFCHAFKTWKLGTLVGTRTWGGVIGTAPRNTLIDGTVTTQPEFAFCFEHLGVGIENHGVEPDVAVDILPQHWMNGVDKQLSAAIEVALDQLQKLRNKIPDLRTVREV